MCLVVPESVQLFWGGGSHVRPAGARLYATGSEGSDMQTTGVSA